jgi:hypothetical protein
VQRAGHAFRISGQLLKQEFRRNETLTLLALRHTQALITQMAQTAVCNRHHSLDQQLCRWLLLSLDHYPLTASGMGGRPARQETTTARHKRALAT